MIKKILEKIGIIFFSVILIAIALFSLFLGFGSVAEIVVKIIKVAGGGSIMQGVVAAPFFIFGVIQIFRGACKVFDSDLKKMNESNESLWHYLYIPATIVGYVAVIIALGNWILAA